MAKFSPSFVLKMSVLSAVLMFTNTGSAAIKKIVVKEQLKRTWTQEYMSYSFDAPIGACHQDSLSLIGPSGDVPVQLDELELWPETEFVKSGKVAFVIDKLDPLTSQSYTLTYGPKAVSEKKLTSDLNVGVKKNLVELSTSQFGVRLALGGKAYKDLIAFNEAMTPISMFKFPEGKWFGGCKLFGDSKVKEVSAELTAKGPVFAEVKTSYIFDDGNKAVLKTRLIAGDYAALFDLDVTKDNETVGFELDFGQKEPLSGAELVSGQRNYTTIYKKPLKSGSTDPLFYLSPWPGDKWFPNSPSSVCFPFENRKDVLQVALMDAGKWVKPQERPVWANFNNWTSEMIMVIWKGWMSKQLPFYTSDNAVKLQINLLSGSRLWAIGLGESSQQLLDRYKCQYMSLYSPLPRLNQVKEMVLEWESKSVKHPCLFMNENEMAQAINKYPKLWEENQKVGAIFR